MRYLWATIAVLLILIFGAAIFRHGGSKPATKPGDHTIRLSDYQNDDSTQVQYTIEGPINALENHQAIKITIGPISREIDVLTGYQGQIQTSKVYANDTNSYTAFLNALTRANFTTTRDVNKNASPDSVCPTGNRTHYQVIQTGNDLMNLWSASCALGTFAGNAPLTATLFQTQIPDYHTITQGVNLGSTGTTTIF